ncbi:MAG TPA: glyoxalase [Gammaproteobacteria bacterium]|nr:glyoxalase [Gammaproteobacteria bacterium]
MKIGAVLHVSYLVADLPRACHFYADVLGLRPDDSRPELGFPGAWFHLGEQQLHLLRLDNPDPVTGRPTHGGWDRHVALAVDSLDELVVRLDAAGIVYTTSRSGRRALFCRDPDGNTLEFIEE